MPDKRREEDNTLWKKALENGKLIASSIMVFSALMVGTWTLTTSIFLTTADANVIIKKLDKDTSYNKAFRLDTKIYKLERISVDRALTSEEKKSMKRMKKQLVEVDAHIDELESGVETK